MSPLMTSRQAGWSSSRTRAPLALADSMASDRPPSDPPAPHPPPEPSARLRTDFAAIAAHVRPSLQRVAVRLSGNASLAEDLVQETLLRALRRFDQFRPGTHPATWMATILTNLYFDYLKHQKVERKAEPELAQPEAIEVDLVIGEIADDVLHAAIRSLEPELRRVVELCYLEQMRYREVAAVLDVPVGTIGTRLMRARIRLRELLTPTNLEVVKP
jgi:RNA polymerase sigma-70 factor, ECF subfamily